MDFTKLKELVETKKEYMKELTSLANDLKNKIGNEAIDDLISCLYAVQENIFEKPKKEE